MKRYCAFLLAAVMLLTACSGEAEISSADSIQAHSTAEAAQPTTELPEVTEEATAEPIQTTSTTDVEPEPVPEQQNEPLKLTVRSDEERVEYFLPIRVIEPEYLPENEFPNPSHIALAKEACWQDEDIQIQIEDFRSILEESRIYPRCVDELWVEQAISYDFDNDGTDESVIVLTVPSYHWIGTAMIYYCDDQNITLLDRGNPEPVIKLVQCGEHNSLFLGVTGGVSGYWHSIWSCTDEGMKMSVGTSDGSISIEFRDTYLLCYPKYSSRAYPVVCDNYGRFCQIQPVHITEQEFRSRVENGMVLLRQLSESGRPIDDIITIGYYDFFLKSGEEYLYFSAEDGTAEICADELKVYSEYSESCFADELIEFDFPAAADAAALYPVAAGNGTDYIPLSYIDTVPITDEWQFSELSALKEWWFSNKEFMDGLPDSIKPAAASEIYFEYGLKYDIDSDGEQESIIVLNMAPPPEIYGCNGIFLCDNDKFYTLFKGGNVGASVNLLQGGDNVYIMFNSMAGAIGYDADICSYRNGELTRHIQSDGECMLIRLHKDGYLLCSPKYAWATWAAMLCPDGVFRQLGNEEITREDFIAHVQGGEKLLSRMAHKGMEMTSIVTAGYLSYWVYYESENEYASSDGNKIYFDLLEGYAHVRSYKNHNWNNGYVLTDEVLTGVDVWALQ
ncbi:MAG: hypothetical protein E7478_02450 [Ruminococcaceae bacterium]|nr:hypothetical protein [Oscillospiraceae bacterium]